jgi:hypothetical protein
MIKFEILASYDYNGGTHYKDIEADNSQDVITQLKNAWYGSGISEGELELMPYLVNADNEEIQLLFGHCNMDDDGEIDYIFDFPNNETECDQWYEFGLFLNNLNGDSFEKALEALFDYESPDRTIGAKLYKLSKIYKTLSAEDKDAFRKNILAETLGIFRDQNKAREMNEWLCSSEGKRYLASNPLFEPAGKELLKAIEQQH